MGDVKYISSAKRAELIRFENLKLGKAKGLLRPRTNIRGVGDLVYSFFTGSTASDAMTESGCSQKTTTRFINSLRSEPKRCLYIDSWGKHSRRWVPVYKIGFKSDARKPSPLTPAERKRNWVSRQRAIKLNQALAGNISLKE